MSPSRFAGYDLRADIIAGFLVFLIALPLSLGIAMASNFPPIAGIITAIVGGIMTSFIGGARLTIKGPAAGLIVIVIGAVTELGMGDPVAGYQRTLAIGVVAGVIQVLLAAARLGFLGSMMPPSVVHGMLAAIGVIIISKQAHTVLGVTPTAKGPLPLLAEIPSSIAKLNPEIFLIGALALFVLFGMAASRSHLLRRIPAPLVVLTMAIPLGLAFDLDHTHVYGLFDTSWQVGPQYLVRLPDSLLGASTLPDFSMLGSWVSIKYIVMFTLVGSIESLLSASAVDALDPAKRASDLDKDLFALGVGNTVASMLGGLPMISEIVRSKANVDNGATSPFANFFHGAFLLLFVALVPGLVQEIPLAALAAMLIFTGTRLASPKEFAHALEIGREQLAVFVLTLLVTLATDLLIGVGVGLVLQLALHVAWGAPLRSLFRNRVDIVRQDETLILTPHDSAIFTNMRGVTRPLERLDASVRHVVLDFSRCRVVGHALLQRLMLMAAEWEDRRLEYRGLDDCVASSPHANATRRRRPP